MIGYIICLANITNKTNIIYLFLIKYKQIIHTILAVKFYGIIHEFDIGVMIKTILEKILGFIIPLILYTDLQFLYNSLVK